MSEESDIEIRPVFGIEDFAGVDAEGELAKQEDVLRDKLAIQESTVQPYLFFGGRCEEAMLFYEQSLGAKVVMKMRFSESPDPIPEGMLQAGFEDKIMHASLTIGKMTILASDGCDDKARFNGFRLALAVSTESAADSAFNALAVGGKIDMLLMKTFWSPRYGMVTDKFGIGWMVMVPGVPGEAT
ncbi:MAG: VOC family protein [Pirellulaceae bacterium]